MGRADRRNRVHRVRCGAPGRLLLSLRLLLGRQRRDVLLVDLQRRLRGAGWQIPEPLFVVLAATAAAIVVLAVRGTVRGVASGALVALGLQTLMMWITYAGTAISGGRIGPGSWIGLAGSLALLVGGMLALIGLFMEPPARGAHAAQ